MAKVCYQFDTLVVWYLVVHHFLQLQPDAFLALANPSQILANLDVSLLKLGYIFLNSVYV